jgi:hypothetical protein
VPDDTPTMRADTKMFIDVNPTSVVITRKDVTSDGEGGISHTLTTLAAQIMRLIPQPASAAVERTTVEGEQIKPEFVLLGEYNADVRHGDWFMRNGAKYELVYVRDDGRSATTKYETWAEVIFRG